MLPAPGRDCNYSKDQEGSRPLRALYRPVALARTDLGGQHPRPTGVAKRSTRGAGRDARRGERFPLPFPCLLDCLHTTECDSIPLCHLPRLGLCPFPQCNHPTIGARCLDLIQESVCVCVCMRPGGEGACVTTLLEMPFGAQRQNFCDAMRDLVVSPAMGVSTLEPGVVWARE